MSRFNRFPRRPHTKNRRLASVRLEVELLEPRNLLNGSPANVLVNNPAEDTTSHDTQCETAIVLGANSNVVVAYNDTGATVIANPGNMGYSLSTNGGASFTDEGSLLASPPYWAGFDPSLARSSKTGTIFLSNNSVNTNVSLGIDGERVNIFRSLDNGATFSTPLSGTPGFGAGVDFADKPWIAVDNYPGTGYGNVYLTWTEVNAVTGIHKAIDFTRSTDDGLTWGPSGGTPIASPGPNGTASFELPFVTVGPDHTVYLFWWDANKGFDILMRKSTDQGQTFSDPVVVTALKTHGNLGDLGLTDSSGRSFHTNTFPQAAVNPVTGDIYVVYNDEGNGSADKADISFTESSDGGKHWSKPLRVNDDTTYNDQWSPSIAVTTDGSHLGLFWYDRRLDPANNLIDHFGVIGTVSGHTVSFAPNFRITDVSFQPAFGQDSYVPPDYMGDYDMATADNSYFYTTWGDNRLGDAFFANQPDVRFAKVPVSGLECDDALLATSDAVAAPVTSTGTSAVRPPKSAPDHLARGGDLQAMMDFLAATAALGVPLPGQTIPATPAAPPPAERAVSLPTLQAIDLFLAAAGKQDGAWAFAAALRGARHSAEDGWGDVLA
jgi:hypothetical protein